MIKKYLFYLVRWQLSTPILAVALLLLSAASPLTATIIANLVGGLIFFWVDRIIFKRRTTTPIWEVNFDNVCVDCGKMDTGYRILEWKGYNRVAVKCPEFRCEECARNKYDTIKANMGEQ